MDKVVRQGYEHSHPRPPDDGAPADWLAAHRLESWKEIAAFLGRSVRTVQRWEEQEGLPVHRHVHSKGGTVFAYKAEVHEWYSRRELTPHIEARSTLENAVRSESAVASVEPVQNARRIRQPFIWGGIALAGVLVLWGVVRLGGPRLKLGAPVTLISKVGRISQTVLSPAGDKVVYCWNGDREENNLDLYLREVQSSGTRRLTSHPNNEHSGAWSPDGKRIAFLRDKEGVFITTPEGGEELRVEAAWPGTVYAVGMSWSPDGRFLVYAAKASAAAAPALYLLNVAHGTRRRLTEPLATGPGDEYPSFAPDGRSVAFVRHSTGIESDVYRVRMPAGAEPANEPEKLTAEKHWIAGFDWLPGGDGLLYSSTRTGPRRLWLQAISRWGTKQAELVPEAGDDIWQPSVARRGGAIAYSRRYWTSSIWRVRLDAGTDPPALQRLIASTRVERDPAWSPDGSRIAFVSERSGSTEIWTSDAEGRNDMQLTSLRQTRVDAPAWSPDGKWIAMAVARSGIHVVPAMGGEVRRVTPESMVCTNPAWLRDGGWIYFSLNTKTGEEVWKAPLTGGRPSMVTAGSRPQLGPDGKLYVLRNSELWVVAGMAGERLIAAPVGSYTVTKEGIYFDQGSGDYTRAVLKFFEFRTRGTRLVTTFDFKKSGGLASSPDGRSLLVSLNDRQVSELVLLSAK